MGVWCVLGVCVWCVCVRCVCVCGVFGPSFMCVFGLCVVCMCRCACVRCVCLVCVCVRCAWGVCVFGVCLVCVFGVYVSVMTFVFLRTSVLCPSVIIITHTPTTYSCHGYRYATGTCGYRSFRCTLGNQQPCWVSEGQINGRRERERA
ncbi:unnamed protein product [Arctogadus glacialis]